MLNRDNNDDSKTHIREHKEDVAEPVYKAEADDCGQIFGVLMKQLVDVCCTHGHNI